MRVGCKLCSFLCIFRSADNLVFNASDLSCFSPSLLCVEWLTKWLQWPIWSSSCIVSVAVFLPSLPQCSLSFRWDDIDVLLGLSILHDPILTRLLPEGPHLQYIHIRQLGLQPKPFAGFSDSKKRQVPFLLLYCILSYYSTFPSQVSKKKKKMHWDLWSSVNEQSILQQNSTQICPFLVVGRIRARILRAKLHRTIQASVQSPDFSVSDHQLATSSSLWLPGLALFICSGSSENPGRGMGHIYWFIVRPQTRIWMKTHMGPSDRCLAAPSIWSSSSSFSSVSTGLQKLPEPFYWGFMEMSLHRHD